MKRLLLAGVGVAIAATAALGADVAPGRPLPLPRTVSYVPFFTWDGAYVGINAGYAFDRFLPYFTGGAAFGAVKGSVLGFGSFTETKVGWTLGGGLEYAFTDNWTAKLEYLYVDLGKTHCNAACSGGDPFDVTFKT